MGVIAALAKGFQYTNRLGLLTGVFLLLQLILALSPTPTASGPMFGPRVLLFLAVLTLYSAGWVMAFGGTLASILHLIRDGKDRVYPLDQLFHMGLQWFWPLAQWASAFMGILLGMAMLGAVALAILAIGGPPSKLLGLVLILISIVGSGAAAFFLLFSPYSLVEKRQSIMEAFKDSARFVREHWLGTLGLLGMLMVLSLVVMMGLGLLAWLLGIRTPQLPLWFNLVSSAVLSYWTVFSFAATFAYYSFNEKQQPVREASLGASGGA